jgi:hypothetical protein
MRIEGNRVTFSRAELNRFAERWPCFGHPESSLIVEFSNGDLVDIDGDERLDGGAVQAILEDAKRELLAYGKRELRAALDRQRRADADSAWLIDEEQAERGRAAITAAGEDVGKAESQITEELNRLDAMGIEL